MTNTRDRAGKEVIQVYYGAPDGELEKSAKELAVYEKTDELQPGESQTLTLSFDVEDMSSYSEDRECYILDAGNYSFYIGNSVKNVEKSSYEFVINTLVKLCS